MNYQLVPMNLDRRTFLKKAGLGLLTLGMSQGTFLDPKSRLGSQVSQYYQALAATTPRKIALLVGINHYGDSNNLKGCLTDVELQQELLISRFGFQPQDILILTEEKATRNGIETAFREHLLAQVQSGDIVVFHYSGYGNQIKIPKTNEVKNSAELSVEWVNSLLPSDSGLSSSQKKPINPLLEDTLLQLARSLPTEQVTLVLDTSYHLTGKPHQGTLKSRSFITPYDSLNPEDLALQKQRQPPLKYASFPGILLNAAGSDQVATEILGEGWSAGLFTYSLTQYLWQITPASQVIITLSRTTEQIALINPSQQTPTLSSDSKPTHLTYNVMPVILEGSEGIIIQVEDNNKAQIKLTGLSPILLNYYGINSCFKVVNLTQDTPENDTDLIVQLTGRTGLTGTIQPVDLATPKKLEKGQILQEKIRILPRNIKLVIALDPNLEKIERVDATSGFSSLVSLLSVSNIGENFADCLFGKGDSLLPLNDPENLPPSSAKYGLFWPGKVLMTHTLGGENEAIKSAIKRLIPQFQTLLAKKLVQMTVNEGSSQLAVSGTLEKIAQTPQTLLYRQTRLIASKNCNGQNASNLRSKLSNCPQSLSSTLLNETSVTSAQDSKHSLKLPIGTPIQYRLENYSDRPVYCLLLALNTGDNTITLYSPPSNFPRRENPSPLRQPVIEAGKNLIIPQPAGDLNWKVSRPLGLVEVLMICSLTPFEKTLEAIKSNHSFKEGREQLLLLSNPLEVVQALLEDLHTASAVKIDLGTTPSDSYTLDVNRWATLSFIYQVVE